MKNIFKIAVNTFICAGIVASTMIGVSASQDKNIAVDGTAIDAGKALYNAAEVSLDGINDGDTATAWQLNVAEADQAPEGEVLVWEDGIYVGVKLDGKYTVDKAVVIVEQGSRYEADKDAVAIEYSTDGSTWKEVKGAEWDFGKEIDASHAKDTVTFEAVEASSIRLVMYKGTERKYAPKLWELEVYEADEGTTPDAPAEDDKDDAPAEDDKTDAPAEDDKTDAPAEDDKTDAPAEDDKTDAPAEDDKDDNKNPSTGVESITLFVVMALAAMVALTATCKARRA